MIKSDPTKEILLLSRKTNQKTEKAKLILKKYLFCTFVRLVFLCVLTVLAVYNMHVVI